MSKSTKIILIIATVCTISGLVIAIVSGAFIGFDFNRLNTQKYVDKVYTVTEDFDSIDIKNINADLQFVLTENECRLECRQSDKITYDVTVENGVLKVKCIDEREWYDHIGIYFEKERVKVYLPKNSFKNLKIFSSSGNVNLSEEFNFGNITIKTNTGNISLNSKASEAAEIESDTGNVTVNSISPEKLYCKTDTGNIALEKIVAGSMDLESDTGNVKLSAVQCSDLDIETNTGNIINKNVVADGKASLSSDTGNVKFDGCDAGELIIETDTGNVKGTLLSDKVFITKTDTGSVKVPETTSGGKCKITTDAGDIKIEIKK